MRIGVWSNVSRAVRACWESEARKILRRVMKHARDQSWCAVFLDFLIVIVGVFIGIQVARLIRPRLRVQSP